MRYGPPGVTEAEARRAAMEHAADPMAAEIPDHIRAIEGGRAAEIKQEELNDLRADEVRRLAEIRRNL